MSERYDDIVEIIQEIREITEGNPSFDDKFLDSIEAQLEARGDLSDRQIEALENILEKWKHR